MHDVLWIGLFLPLAGALFLLFFSGKLSRTVVNIVGPSMILFSFICFCTLLYRFNHGFVPSEAVLFTWLPIPGFHADFSLFVDHLSLLMTLIITGVGFLIHAYSAGYMEDDADIARYFAEMNFFIFSMLLLVTASDFLVFFIGWEGVGLASYLLIGYYYQKPEAASACKKAFVVNRIGDFGLLLGIFLTYYLFGTGDMQYVGKHVLTDFTIGAPVLSVLALLYLCGAVGKSAQLPLHVWLPDAMEGPTPVSALIHAATMVTAGVYLVVRMHPVFEMAPSVLSFVGYLGAITSFYAALSASGQKDLKRVLAYSTISQLGLMFLACGVGAYFAAMFHLTMHAFVKALLFLSAGNVIHMMHGTTHMDEMGGLKKVFPKTQIFFLIGALSMSGIPPLAIFFSKDLILDEGYNAGCMLCYIVGLGVSLFTAFYLTRAYFLTFQGPSNVSPSLLQKLKEAPRVMLIPVGILAFLAAVGGFLGFALNKPPILMRFLQQDTPAFTSDELSFGFHLSPETMLSIVVAFTGVFAAAFMYTSMRTKLGKTLHFLTEAFYIDALYWKVIVRPLRRLSRVLTDFFEPFISMCTISAPKVVTQKTASVLALLQSGQIRTYASYIVFGGSVLLLYLVLRGV